MDISIIGAGSVAQAFARHALKVGHTMKISNSRGPSTLGETVHTLGAERIVQRRRRIVAGAQMHEISRDQCLVLGAEKVQPTELRECTEWSGGL